MIMMIMVAVVMVNDGKLCALQRRGQENLIPPSIT